MRIHLKKQHFLFLSVILFGFFLRLYLLKDQILLDDEWHSITCGIEMQLQDLLTSLIIPGPTSIPMNCYNRILLTTVGYSEILLRLPSVIPGLLSLIIFPYLVSKLLGRKISLFFLCLLAISPFLIFYSRVARPYSMFVFLSFITILCEYFWMTSGKHRYCILSIIAGVIAVYFQPFAIIAVFIPLLHGFVLKNMSQEGAKKRKQINIVPSSTNFIWTFGIIGISSCLLLLHPLIKLLNGAAPDIVGVDRITLETTLQFTSILSGSSNTILVILFLVFLISGMIILFKKAPFIAGIFISVFIAYTLVLIISRPSCAFMPIVIARYSIPVFPLSYIFVAIGLDGILRKLQRIFLMSHSTKNKLQGKRLVITHACSSMSCNLIPVFFFIVLFAMGPLPRVYSSPNNFTNHSAFQESYKPLTWKESYPSHVDTNPMIEESEIPLFYRRLSQDLNKYIIIEYPMDIADASNLLYYYQHIHKKRIMAGYVLQSVVAGYIEMHGIPTTTLTRFTYEYIDERLENVDSKKLNFRNMINMVNIDAIKASQARYIVLHKDVQHVQNDSSTDATVMVYKPILYLQELYQKFWGIPVFEDRNIIVFKIPK